MTHEYRIAPGEPYYARVVDIPAGVLVVLCRADRPKGQRKISERIFDLQTHIVLDAVHDALFQRNKGPTNDEMDRRGQIRFFAEISRRSIHAD